MPPHRRRPLQDGQRQLRSPGRGQVCCARWPTELAAELRGTDTVYRIGGDEFAVLASADNDYEVAAIAERLLDAARRVRATVSVGAVLLNRDDPHVTRLTADRSLYEAKAAGRDRARTAHFESTSLDPAPS
ncbi:MAG: diguanylate cyclase [Nocardioidaceae bacterium]